MAKPSWLPDEDWQKAEYYSTLYGVPGQAGALLAAIGKHETDWGKQGWGKQGFTLGYGAYSETNADFNFAGLDNQLEYAAKQIGSWFTGKQLTQDSLKQFAQESWKVDGGNEPAAKAWSSSIWKLYTSTAAVPETPKDNAFIEWVKKTFKTDQTPFAKDLQEYAKNMPADTSLAGTVKRTTWEVLIYLLTFVVLLFGLFVVFRPESPVGELADALKGVKA